MLRRFQCSARPTKQACKLGPTRMVALRRGSGSLGFFGPQIHQNPEKRWKNFHALIWTNLVCFSKESSPLSMPDAYFFQSRIWCNKLIQTPGWPAGAGLLGQEHCGTWSWRWSSSPRPNRTTESSQNWCGSAVWGITKWTVRGKTPKQGRLAVLIPEKKLKNTKTG